VVSLRPRHDRIFYIATVVVAVIAVVTLVVSPSGESTEGVEPLPAADMVVPQPETIEAETVSPPEPPRIRTCQVDPGIAVVSGLEFAGSVALLDSGEVLWEVDASEPVVPASVLKLVTARAALRVLGPDFRFITKVVEGREPGEWWLVGGGDPTLTRTRPGSATYYTDPARLTDLVNQLREAQGDTPASDAFVRVGIDSSRYDSFPEWNDTWRPNGATLGFVAPVTALMVDGGRFAPAERLSQRTGDPIGQAATSFIRQLSEASRFWRTEVVTGVAPANARTVGEVSSPPLSVLVDQMIRDSDNQIAEALIREVALSLGVTDVNEAAGQGLDYGMPDRETFFADDGSGLSQDNAMTAALATSVVASLATDLNSAVIIDAIPRPGEPGSLERRFVGFESAWPNISGKTGSLQGVRSLAGVIAGDDPLVYSVFVSGPQVDDDARVGIDSLVAKFHGCGENLAHWVPTEQGE